MASLTAPPDGDQNRGIELITVAWVECSIAIIFVGMRFYSRIRLTRNLWWDDWFIAITLALTITFSGFWTVLAASDGCRHLFYLDADQRRFALRLNWITQPFAIAALATGKISVAFLLLRIIGSGRWRKTFLWFMMATNFLFCSLAIIFTFVQCRPVSALWDLNVKAKCWRPETQSNFSLFTGSWLAFSDVALALFPITILWDLKLSMQKKAALSSLMGMGIFAAICACLKTSKLPSLNARADLTWETVTLWIWNANEINVVMIAACIPTLRPLYLVLFNKPGATAYLKHPYHHSNSEQRTDSHARTTSPYTANPDRRSISAHEALVAVPFTSEEQRLGTPERQESDAHGSWLDVESVRLIVPKRSGSIRQTIELDVRYSTRAQNSHEGIGLEVNQQKGSSMF